MGAKSKKHLPSFSKGLSVVRNDLRLNTGPLKKEKSNPKHRPKQRLFPMNIAEFLRKPILKNICEQLLLSIMLCSIFIKVYKSH